MVVMSTKNKLIPMKKSTCADYGRNSIYVIL